MIRHSDLSGAIMGREDMARIQSALDANATLVNGNILYYPTICCRLAAEAQKELGDEHFAVSLSYDPEIALDNLCTTASDSEREFMRSIPALAPRADDRYPMISSRSIKIASFHFTMIKSHEEVKFVLNETTESWCLTEENVRKRASDSVSAEVCQRLICFVVDFAETVNVSDIDPTWTKDHKAKVVLLLSKNLFDKYQSSNCRATTVDVRNVSFVGDSK